MWLRSVADGLLTPARRPRRLRGAHLDWSQVNVLASPCGDLVAAGRNRRQHGLCADRRCSTGEQHLAPRPAKHGAHQTA